MNRETRRPTHSGEMTTIVVLMGVSGSGKTTIGERLAERMGWPFYDGDAFHPPANVEKMSRGEPLEDADRWPWLEAIRDHMRALSAEGRSAVVACSALKASYRDILLEAGPGVWIVYLKGSHPLIQERLEARTGHFFDPVLLASQLETLEEPTDVVSVDVARPLDDVVATIVDRLDLDGSVDPSGPAGP